MRTIILIAFACLLFTSCQDDYGKSIEPLATSVLKAEEVFQDYTITKTSFGFTVTATLRYQTLTGQALSLQGEMRVEVNDVALVSSSVVQNQLVNTYEADTTTFEFAYTDLDGSIHSNSYTLPEPDLEPLPDSISKSTETTITYTIDASEGIAVPIAAFIRYSSGNTAVSTGAAVSEDGGERQFSFSEETMSAVPEGAQTLVLSLREETELEDVTARGGQLTYEAWPTFDITVTE